MTRAAIGSESRRSGSNAIVSVSSQRLVAAGARALEAHARVQRLAEHLCAELDHVTSPNGVPLADLDPEDSMVVAVERVITTAKTMPPPFAETPRQSVETPRTATKLGMAPLRKPTER